MLIFGYNIKENTKRQINITPDKTNYSMPATIISGSNNTKNTKTILITAGLHSGEYPAIKATIELAKFLNPEDIQGTIIIIHCVNISGFLSRSIDVLPEDNSNLNKNYPGNKNGTIGDKLANFFVTNIFPNIDFLVDMHSGGKYEELTPCLFYQTRPNVKEISYKIASATNIPYLIPSTASQGHYSYAGTLGIPAVLLERGYGGLCNKIDVENYKEDLLGILHTFNFITTSISNNISYNNNQFNVKDTIYLESTVQGLWYPNIKSGQSIKKGDLLGTIEDFFGNILIQYFAQLDGIIFYYTTDLSVDVSNPLVAYGSI